jgi:hypothetical protein
MSWRFAASLLASFVVMYLLAFSQIDRLAHFELSLSVFWITLSMVSTMGLIMLTTMGGMVGHGWVRAALYAGFGLVLAGAFAASRTRRSWVTMPSCAR